MTFNPRSSFSSSSPWLPIETAPTDWTKVDLWAGGRRIADCQWSPSWQNWVSGDGIPIRLKITHWMPTPGPPEN